MFDESIDGRKDVLMARHILEGVWTVLFHPVDMSTAGLSGYVDLPGQVVLSFDWQICNNSLPSGSCVLRTEVDCISCCNNIDIHIISEVRHFDFSQIASGCIAGLTSNFLLPKVFGARVDAWGPVVHRASPSANEREVGLGSLNY